ncbi:AAA family ATPase [Candidatus Thiothrix anitrata]|uniref:AAA family ATPase n=1 Tax=Candidatus Thiothrix anitrata TaxID=2823902 RepID=A0ABX7X441_9GAMM|nr:AAA family ATPase [Candidatus Thiothrix anitrata]QTR49573.1 AAA family ATPase [Candidatus Thiothrix anitrata]
MNENLIHLKSLHIEGFRSLKDVQLQDMQPLTVLIGANGAGKSNLMRFFEMLSWMLKGQKLQEFIGDQGGADDQLFMGAKRTPHLKATIVLETAKGMNDYAFTLSAAAANKLIFVEERYRFSASGQSSEAKWSQLPVGGSESALVDVAQTAKTTNATAKAIVHLLRGIVSYQFHDTSKNAYLKQAWDMNDYAFLRSHGGNVAAVLLYLRENHVKRFQLIEKQIRRVLPSFGGFELNPVAGRVELRWQHKFGDKTMGAHLTSDGSLRLFCLVTLLNLPREMLPPVILLDEPELGLHPNAVVLVAAMIRTLSARCQVILATQSPLMVDGFSLDDITVVDVEAGATELRKLSQAQYQQWLDDNFTVSDLWLSNVIGGQP